MNNETKIKIGESVGLTFCCQEKGLPMFIGKQEQFNEYFAALELSECCDAKISSSSCTNCGEGA